MLSTRIACASGITVLCCVAALAAAADEPAGPPAASEGATQSEVVERRRKPPIVLISLDTLRADHLGCYGYSRDTSPNIDVFVKDAVLFEQYVNTGGGTLPVHMSMLTSLHPTVHDVDFKGTRPLDPARITLAEQLAEAGYTNVAFVDGGRMFGGHGFTQGFDIYDDRGGRFRRILPKVYEWLDANHSEQFFLFVHTYDIHSQYNKLPYDSPRGFNQTFARDYSGSFDGCRDGLCASTLLMHLNEELAAGRLKPTEVFSPEDLEYLVALYDGGIRYVDDELSRFFGRLKELGLYEEALIIVTSDHGEAFFEHGRLLHKEAYEEIARIPLIVKLPGATGAGLRIKSLYSVLDLMPTILDVAGVAPNEDVQGRSLVPVIGGASLEARDVRIGAGQKGKLRMQQWSYVSESTRTGRPPRLFYLPEDPGEQRDLIDSYALLAERFEAEYQAGYRADRERLARFSKGRTRIAPVEMSPEKLEELRGLGYLE